MTSLLTNISAMTALTTLKGINSQLDITSNRVSTGQRVSSASDNAAYWSIATTVRTDNASLSAVKDSLGLGSSAVDTAYNGLNSILTDMQNLRAKLQTALQPGVDRSKVQTEIAAIQSKMKATADSSVSSGQNWLSVDSSNAATYKATQKIVAGFSRDSNGAINLSNVDVGVSEIALYDANTSATVTTPAIAAQVTGTKALTGTIDFSSLNEVSFSISTKIDAVTTNTANIVLNKTSLKAAVADLAKVTTTELLDAINNQIAASGTANLKRLVKASLDGDGRLTFETTSNGSVPAGSADRSVVIQNIARTATAQTAVDIGFGTNNGLGADNAVGGGDDDAVLPKTSGFGTAAGTTSVKGILDTIDGTTNFSVQSIDLTKLASGTAGDTTLKQVITQLDKALSKVTDAGTQLGAKKTQIDGQKTFIDTLMKANDRTIGILVDADIEEESTKLKALQTQQQLAVQALSIANSSSQNVLSLFR
ncbi:flagellin [Methylobacterium crusticola]|uniref:flagellin N-terminal helical domain-containing protein n=1 Tax=Methylobacterium crusticola TaxID=1697972 RepID=UPI000FFC6CD8|nr:flagellin [Methylobacterium crusticola]